MMFDDKEADHKLKEYRKKGPADTTRILIDALKAAGVTGTTLLDIGGGVGAIQHELLKSGAHSAIDVDASTAYIQLAEQEARQQGYGDRVSFYHGNFVELAPQIPVTDIVTLDRVICCYHDMHALVGLSAARARKFYGLVYPREAWWMKIGLSLFNFFSWAQRNPFRVFMHPTDAVERVVSNAGLKRRFYRRTFIWQVIVYAR